ncbi:MAG: Sec-independent protein translocase protein TatB [Porticoccaceae bacterium]
MFDIGFAELMLIGLIALIVIGPKRLPEAARFIGYWTGKLRRTVGDARQEMEREFGIDEIKREVHNSLLLEQLDKERREVEEQFNQGQNKAAKSSDGDQSSLADQDMNVDVDAEDIDFIDDDDFPDDFPDQIPDGFPHDAPDNLPDDLPDKKPNKLSSEADNTDIDHSKAEQ